MREKKATIFGEEHFIDNTMIELIETKNNIIDNMVFDKMEKSIRITLPFVKINAEKLRKWVDLCMQLENIEHSELINIATKKKILDLQSELEELKKNAIVPKFKIGQEVWYALVRRSYSVVGSTKITSIKISEFGHCYGAIRDDNQLVYYDEINLFNTKAEAEEALKKLEE